jgi:hypothetical protein
MRTYVAVKVGVAAGDLTTVAAWEVARCNPLKSRDFAVANLATWQPGNLIFCPVAREMARARPPHNAAARKEPRGRDATCPPLALRTPPGPMARGRRLCLPPLCPL